MNGAQLLVLFSGVLAFAALALAFLSGANRVLDPRDLARRAEAAHPARTSFYPRWFTTATDATNRTLPLQHQLPTLTRQAPHVRVLEP
ncbi:hypothetical protein I8R59_29805, partial [Klebsiella pneumoniae]|nr:hypothetical protein [Klebsiella pneumoniae]